MGSARASKARASKAFTRTLNGMWWERVVWDPAANVSASAALTRAAALEDTKPEVIRAIWCAGSALHQKSVVIRANVLEDSPCPCGEGPAPLQLGLGRVGVDQLGGQQYLLGRLDLETQRGGSESAARAAGSGQRRCRICKLFLPE